MPNIKNDDRLAGGGVEDDAVALALEASNAYWADESLQPNCQRCNAKGYHHGFGEDGADPDWCGDCGGVGFIHHGSDEGAMRAALNAAFAALRQRCEQAEAKVACAMGVGDGDGQLFVYGDHESIKAAQALVMRAEGWQGRLLRTVDEVRRAQMEGLTIQWSPDRWLEIPVMSTRTLEYNLARYRFRAIDAALAHDAQQEG